MLYVKRKLERNNQIVMKIDINSETNFLLILFNKKIIFDISLKNVQKYNDILGILLYW